MPDPGPPETSDRERRLEEIIAAFLVAEDQGQPLALEAIFVQHPDLVDELHAFFKEHRRIGSLVAPLREVALAGSAAAETTYVGSDSALAASSEPIDLRYQSTEILTATKEPSTKWEADPNATAPGSPDAAVDSDPIEAGAHVRYFGDYVLQGVLGKGGMGVVYKARQISLNRPVALKMLQAGILATEDDLRRFQNEAEAVAMLDHPHIVPILEVGQYDEHRYFSMKLIGGPSLDRKLSQFTNNVKAAARLVRTVAEAVHHAHQRGILHRDLKPGNIILDDRGAPHVTDFGLAKRVQADSELTQSGAILGTPAYMAPEQASGKRGMVTTATDVYGLGAILYALLTGRAPFGGESPVETLEQVRERKPESPSKLNPLVPRDLETITLKCLEKEPLRRYASAQALADDLRRYLSGESILARPVWLATRAWMWCKRKPALAGLASALIFALLIVMAIELARRRETEVRKAAESNFMMAQTAVEDFLTSVNQNTLLREQDSVEIRSLRKELLKSALNYYERFVNERRNDPALREPLANAYFQVGAIAHEIESRERAIKAFRSAQTIWESLLNGNPDKDELGLKLAQCHLAIGKQQAALGELQAAMASFVPGRAILEKLTSRKPEQEVYQANLADCYSQIGIIQGQLESGDSGLEILEKAKKIQQTLIGRSLTDQLYKKSLAEIINALGFVYEKRLDYANASRSFEEVQQICQSLLSEIGDSPKPVRLLDLMALAQYNMAIIHGVSKKLDKVPLELFEKSLANRAALVALHPSVKSFQENLGKSYCEFALGQHRANQTEKALDTLSKSISILEKLVESEPGQARYHAELSRSWNARGYMRDELRENDQAIPAFEKAINELRTAIARSRDDNAYKASLSLSLENLGEQFVDLGQVDAGLTHYLEARDLRRQLHSSHPESVEYAQDWSDALVVLGGIYRHAGDFSAAQETLLEARRVAESFAASEPDDPARQTRLAVALTREAESVADLKEIDAALELLDKAVAIWSKLAASTAPPEDVRKGLSESLWERARLLRSRDQAADADKLDLEREALWKGRASGERIALVGEELKRASVIGYGKTTVPAEGRLVRELVLDQAAANLRLAIGLGYSDLDMLRSDPRYALLLSRDDIGLLLMDMTFPSWPFDHHR
jgi:eukaryotic-like serine/threonine-protein kinase